MQKFYSARQKSLTVDKKNNCSYSCYIKEKKSVFTIVKKIRSGLFFLPLLFKLFLFSAVYAQPTIISFSPQVGPVGTVVAIKGTNFSSVPANNIVYFGAVKALVTTATNTSLLTIVPSGATYQPITITVNNLTAFSTKEFVVTFPHSCSLSSFSFEPKRDFYTGNFPFSTSAADFDGDGKIDFAAANYSDKTFSLFKNTSISQAISFLPKVDYPTDANPGSIFTSDIDGDGKLDIVVASDVSTTVSVYRNISTTGIILFDTRINFPTGAYPANVSVADLNSDGKADLVITNNQQNSVSVFKNKSTPGVILFEPKIEFMTGNSPSGILLKDLNQDGKLDIAIANQFSNSISILKNIGAGTSILFGDKIDIATNSEPYDMSSGDIDGDGKPELIAGSLTSNKIAIFKNTSTNGGISFSEKIDFTIGTSPRLAAVGDLNGDGKPDLAIASSEISLVVLTNSSSEDSISFDKKIDLPVSGSSSFVSIADIDNDGKPDILVAVLSTVSILRNRMSLFNSAPFVNIVDPPKWNKYTAGSNIDVAASAFDIDGGIAKVEFYNDNIKIGEDTTDPYDYFAKEVEPGTYSIKAKAIDNCGDTAMSDTLTITVTGCTASGSISAEGYSNIPGSQVADLTGNAAYPNNPTVLASLDKFEYGNDLGSNYGARVRGYICAPQTGNYTFYIAADDQAGLWLSSDDDPGKKVLIAYAVSHTSPRQWNKYPTQKSASIRLVKGGRYYIETLHKELVSADHLAIAWTQPDGTFEAPIQGNRLSPYNILGGGRLANFTQLMQLRDIDKGNRKSFKITATPNPSYNEFTVVTTSGLDKPLNVHVMDISGRVLEERSNVAANGTFYIGNKLPAGIYLIEVTQGIQMQRVKVVKL
jgi:hypothetical protein